MYLTLGLCAHVGQVSSYRLDSSAEKPDKSSLLIHTAHLVLLDKRLLRVQSVSSCACCLPHCANREVTVSETCLLRSLHPRCYKEVLHPHNWKTSHTGTLRNSLASVARTHNNYNIQSHSIRSNLLDLIPYEERFCFAFQLVNFLQQMHCFRIYCKCQVKVISQNNVDNR